MRTTTKGFPIHTPDTAPEGSRAALARSQASYGMVPNLHGILAEAPAALEGYAALVDLVSESSLSPAEQQVVYLASNYENECRYCMAGHSALAASAGLDAAAVGAIRDGRAIKDARLEALRRFASLVVTQRGWVGEDETRAFMDAGFARRQSLEVVTAVAAKVISNYTNHLADTPLDGFMGETVWTPPRERTAA